MASSLGSSNPCLWVRSSCSSTRPCLFRRGWNESNWGSRRHSGMDAGAPSSWRPCRPRSRSFPLQGLILAAIVAFVVRGLFMSPGPIGASLPWKTGADEIFLLHRSGILLRHVSSKRARETDTDILGGMLAAVRMFVEDSMSPTAGPLQEIRFRGGSIVFVTGSNATLAAVNTRGNRDRFAHRAKSFLQEFEAANGAALVNFDDVTGPLRGVDSLLNRIAS